MRLPFLTASHDDYVIRPLEAGDGERLETLHAEGFARPWSEAEFDALLSQEAVFGNMAVPVARRRGGPVGFVLARRAADEAEILMIAVARAHRRKGVGRLLMDSILRELHAARAAALFLEVDEANVAAIALYRRLGFRQVGSRPDYYASGRTGRGGALVMRRDLR